MFSFQMLKLTISNFALEDSSECQSDSVLVYPGSDTSSGVLSVLCGVKTSPVVVTVPGNEAFITFTSDASFQSTGFQVSWEEVVPPPPPPPSMSLLL